MCNIKVPINNAEKITTVWGFDKKNEFLSNLDIFDDKTKQRRIFYNFFNNQINNCLHFNKYEINKWINSPLNEVFIMKIKLLYGVNFIPFSYDNVNTTNVFQPFCASVQKLLNLSNYFGISPLTTIEPNIKKANNLFAMIGKDNISFMLNAQYAFEEFIVDKLSKIHKEEEILQYKDSIDLIVENNEKIKILPYWQMILPSEYNINEHISKAVDCIKNSSFKHVYLVYPKNKKFTKHIEIKVSELDVCGEYKIKIIPYSLRSILRKRITTC